MNRRRFSIDGGWDIETSGETGQQWTGFVMGGVWTPQDGYRYVWGDIDAYADLVISQRGDLFGWNCGLFETIHVLESLLRRGYKSRMEPVFSGSRVVSVGVGDVRLNDGMGFAPMKLDDALRIINRRKAKMDIPCECPDALVARRGECGGYCAIRVDMHPHLRAKLIDYNEQDCKDPYDIISYLMSFWETQGWDTALTLGSSAWHTVQRLYDLPAAKYKTSQDYNHGRKAYYGGQTGNLKYYSSQGEIYDIRNAYPAAQAQIRYPVGNSYRWVHGPSARMALRRGDIGVYQATVVVPETIVAPLPVRTRGGIEFPFGTFTGYWTGNDLAHAMERGTKVEQVFSGMVWDDSECSNFYAGMLEMAFTKRQELSADCPKCSLKTSDEHSPGCHLGSLVKRWACCVSGGNGMKATRDILVINPDIGETDYFCPSEECHDVPRDCGYHNSRKCCVHVCNRWCGGVRPYGRSDYAVIKTMYRISARCHVVAAAYVTAHVRGRLQDLMYASGIDLAVMYDTDGFSTEGKLPSQYLGTALGQVKHEDTYYELHSKAPKLSACLVKNGKDGFRVRSRGVRLDSQEEFRFYVGLDPAPNPESLPDHLAVDSSGKVVSVYHRGVKSLKASLRSGGELLRRKRVVRQHRQDKLTISRHVSQLRVRE